MTSDLRPPQFQCFFLEPFPYGIVLVILNHTNVASMQRQEFCLAKPIAIGGGGKGLIITSNLSDLLKEHAKSRTVLKSYDLFKRFAKPKLAMFTNL